MTDRVLRAIENPHVDILGHPTGRMLLKREAYPIDIEAIVAAAASNGLAMEINSQAHRLDLNDVHARLAHNRGVRIVISSDAHSQACAGLPALGRPDSEAGLAAAGRCPQHEIIRRLPRLAAPPSETIVNLRMLTTDDKLAEIRRLYFKTTKQTIEQDLAKALDLLKSMPSEDERERATVYMEGMAQMRRDWAGKKGKGKQGEVRRKTKSKK